ncbi:hypothetical protein FOL46_005788 [Perkinsus olseni]|uniref:C2HC/C3H-type domain-containing protein n=1 Tax=Perkinsus olseni TaxID=32597 RepID=A0A7J6LQM8_PEROL|nr:hypothetical protein FOL46_005788 [Perkinsus olseni]
MAGAAQGPHRRAVPCPSCGQHFFPQSLRFHLKSCVVKQQHVELPCPFCDTPVKRSELENHTTTCRKRKTARKSLSVASLLETSPSGRTPCVICQRSFSSDRIAKHQAICRQQSEQAERRKSLLSTPQKKLIARQQAAVLAGSGSPTTAAWRQKRDAQKEAFERIKRQQRSRLQGSIGRTLMHEIVGVDATEVEVSDGSSGSAESESSRCSTNDTGAFPLAQVDSSVPETIEAPMDSTRVDAVPVRGKWASSSPVALKLNDESDDVATERSGSSRPDEEELPSEASSDGSDFDGEERSKNDHSERHMPPPPRRSPPPASSSATSSRMDTERSDAHTETRDSEASSSGPTQHGISGLHLAHRELHGTEARTTGQATPGRKSSWRFDGRSEDGRSRTGTVCDSVGSRGARPVDAPNADRSGLESMDQSPTSGELPVQRNLRGWLVGEDADLQDALDRASVALAKARSLRPENGSSTSSTPSSRSEEDSPPPLVCTRRPRSQPAWELEVHQESHPRPEEGPMVIHYHHHHHHHYPGGLPGDIRMEEAEKKAVDDAVKVHCRGLHDRAFPEPFSSHLDVISTRHP